MKISDNVTEYQQAVILLNMCEGILPMILKAPNSEKREMLCDTITYAKKVAKNQEKSQSAINYFIRENTRLQCELEMAKRRVAELHQENNNLKEQIKELMQ